MLDVLTAVDVLTQSLQAFGLHDDPVFLTVFVILSYRRLTNPNVTITIGSTLLSALIAASCTRLIPHATNAMALVGKRATAPPAAHPVESPEEGESTPTDLVEMLVQRFTS